MTRKVFRFFKHKGCVLSIRGGVARLRLLLRKFEQTSKHQLSIQREFFGSKVEIEPLETILEEKSHLSDSMRRGSALSELHPEEAELRQIKNPEFIDSKTQLSLRIANEALGIVADFFELTYYCFDHLSFLGKIEVIQNPRVRKVPMTEVGGLSGRLLLAVRVRPVFRARSAAVALFEALAAELEPVENQHKKDQKQVFEGL